MAVRKPTPHTIHPTVEERLSHMEESVEAFDAHCGCHCECDVADPTGSPLDVAITEALAALGDIAADTEDHRAVVAAKAILDYDHAIRSEQ